MSYRLTCGVLSSVNLLDSHILPSQHVYYSQLFITLPPAEGQGFILQSVLTITFPTLQEPLQQRVGPKVWGSYFSMKSGNLR